MKIRCDSGFTLVEIAIALFILALLLGTGLTLLSTELEQRHVEDTREMLYDARELLLGYALAHFATGDARPYLPCPDAMPGTTVSVGNVANDGQEDRNAATGACDVQEGNFPWVTLGLTPQSDAWANRLRYRVSSSFSNRSAGMQLAYAGDINVLDAASGGNSIALDVPAIILSHGRNGLGAINSAGLSNPMPTGTNETANTDITVNFVSHTPTPAGVAGGYFDDQLIWLSQYVLFNRLVQAGRLP